MLNHRGMISFKICQDMLLQLEEDFEMEDKNARIAEIESQIKQLQSELADLKEDQPQTNRNVWKVALDELYDEMERGEWSPGGKHYSA